MKTLLLTKDRGKRQQLLPNTPVTLGRGINKTVYFEAFADIPSSGKKLHIMAV